MSNYQDFSSWPPQQERHFVAFEEASQQNGKKAMMTTGCPYGDQAGYAKVLAYLQGLK